MPVPVTDNNRLSIIYPQLVSEWSDKNPFPPSHYGKSSAKKVWWVCQKGHEWLTAIYARTSLKHGCPECQRERRQTAPLEKSLAILNPDLASEWDYDKNHIVPSAIYSNSIISVWWVCKNGHQWKCPVVRRTTAHQSCPYCSFRKASPDNCLSTMQPWMASEWDYDKNGSLLPTDVTQCHKKKIWWKCVKGHSWEARCNSRYTYKSGCPYCCQTNAKASPQHNLQIDFPYLAKEWHPTKNRDITPYDVTPGSQKKVWWKCPKGVDHEWDAVIAECANADTNGSPL